MEYVPCKRWVSGAGEGDGEFVQCGYSCGGAASETHRLSSWVVSASEASGSLNVRLPGNAVAGGTATVGVAWSGLATGGRYMGGFQLKDPSGVVQSGTAVRVNTDGTAPVASPDSGVSSNPRNK